MVPLALNLITPPNPEGPEAQKPQTLRRPKSQTLNLRNPMLHKAILQGLSGLGFMVQGFRGLGAWGFGVRV